MAIYHFSAKVFSRAKGVSSVAKAAYRSASYLVDERTGLEYNYTKRREQIEAEIFAPESAPAWATDRSKLWNAVEAKEKRSDAQVAREINAALPKELTKDQQKALVREYVNEHFVSKGMVADVAFHFNDNNPHIHVMLTMREINQDGFQNKNRDWNNKDLIESWREGWAQTVNKHLEVAKVNQRIDHRSFQRQGSKRLPTMHMGVKYHHMERRGIQTRVGELNRQVKDFNTYKVVELEEYKRLRAELQQMQQKLEPKRYYAKSPKFKLKMQVYRAYKNEFPAVRYFNYSQSKALFNINSNYGKFVTIQGIVEAFHMLVKFKELESKVIQELNRMNKSGSIIKEINQRKNEIAELMKNPLTRLANKTKVAALENEIQKLERELTIMGVKQDTYYDVRNNLEETKKKVDTKMEEYRLVEKGKDAIDKAQSRYDKSMFYRKRKSKLKGQDNDEGRRSRGR